MENNIKVTGRLSVELRDGTGQVKTKFDVPNLVVSAGKDVIASRLIGDTPAVMSHMAVGSDTGSILALATSNTSLGEQISDRVELSSVTVANNVVSYSATFAAGVSSGAITEAGIFNSLTAGSMLCRTIFPVINKEADDVLTINWQVTVS